jgi:hypothetical protein
VDEFEQDKLETYRAQIEVILASALERLDDRVLGRLRAAVKERHGDGPAMLATPATSRNLVPA